MAHQTPEQNRRLIVFITLVLMLLAPIYFVNRRIRSDESALSTGGNAKLRAALERLQRNPELSVTMGPGIGDERHLRHLNARLIPRPDVLVIGQSDADHMSGTFFKPGINFYNGFLSNSVMAYNYEVFDEIVEARGMPGLVLFDIRTGHCLAGGIEPSWDTPSNDPQWYDGPPKSRGDVKTPWYRDIDSLLSLQQTEFSARWLWARYRANKASVAPDADIGAPFLVVPANKPSGVHRWLADGSRVYPGEVDGILIPLNKPVLTDEVGERKVGQIHIKVLAELLDLFRARGAKVILYLPPLLPRVFEQDPRQVGYVHSLGDAIREIADKRDFDFCDLAASGKEIGCRNDEFYDEHHLARGCDRKVVRALANGCAKRFGPKLKEMLTEATLRE